MYAASFFKRVENIPRSLCLVVGGVMSGALYLGGVMTVNPLEYKDRILAEMELHCSSGSLGSSKSTSHSFGIVWVGSFFSLESE